MGFAGYLIWLNQQSPNPGPRRSLNRPQLAAEFWVTLGSCSCTHRLPAATDAKLTTGKEAACDTHQKYHISGNSCPGDSSASYVFHVAITTVTVLSALFHVSLTVSKLLCVFMYFFPYCPVFQKLYCVAISTIILISVLSNVTMQKLLCALMYTWRVYFAIIITQRTPEFTVCWILI